MQMSARPRLLSIAILALASVPTTGSDAVPSRGEFFAQNSLEIRLDRYDAESRLVEQCMASRFDYTAPPAALQFDLGVVTEVIDPLFFALDARYRETFGLELAVAQVEEFHKLGKLSPSELAREVALYGDPLTPGCIPQEGSLAGLWRLPDLQDEFDTIFREEIEKIIANENFQTADRQFVACTSTTQYPFPTLLRPPDAVFAEMYQMLVDTSPLVEAGTLTFDGVVDLSSDINEGMYATYQDCLASVSGLLDPAWCPHCVHSDGFI